MVKNRKIYKSQTLLLIKVMCEDLREDLDHFIRRLKWR